MPGENCAIVGCSTSRRHKGISIFKVPLPNNELNKKWNRDLINIITKDRQLDEPLKKRIAICNLYICERHFSPEQIWKYPSRKVLKDGALPSLNLPEKSIASSKSSHTPLLVLHRQIRREKNILNLPLFLHHHLVIFTKILKILKIALPSNL